MHAATPRAAEIADQLGSRIEELALDLLGPPTMKAGRDWRWRDNCSLSVAMRGPKRGRFFDHLTKEGGDALDLVRLARAGTMTEALRWAAAWLGSPAQERPHRPPARAVEAEEDDAARTARALAIWRETRPLRGSPAEAYLRGRGIALPAEIADLAFHPSCPFGRDRVPAMVALMRDAVTDAPVAIHRTALRLLPDGAAQKAGPDAKRMLGPSAGAVIKLAPAEDAQGLGIAEGIENALTVMAAGWSPIWAAGSAGAIQTFPVLAGFDGITVFADADKTGMAAAEACCQRWTEAGREARIIVPRATGADFNSAMGVAA